MSEEINTEAQEKAAETPKPQKYPRLYHNYISLFGMVLAAASIVSIIFLFLMEATGSTESAYVGILLFILLPGVLVLGILVIIAGMIKERIRRRKMSPEEILAYPILDLNGPRRRRAFLMFLAASFIFLLISAFGSYRAFEYTESVEFCGQVCHTVMNPEFVAWQASPHSKIACVECHVGGGAEYYVRAKMGGVRQLFRVLTGTYSTPIATPVHGMRAANETCGKCHWPEKYYGEQIRVFRHYGYDEKNSPNITRLLVKVGGGNPVLGEANGIHWHMNLTNEITYIASDERRQVIPWVQMKDGNGNVTEFLAKSAAPNEPEVLKGEKRKMDCIDCHNRPTHIYLSPDAAVDQALTAQKLDINLPYIKTKAVELLSAEYETKDKALAAIGNGLDYYYRTDYPDVYANNRPSVEAAVEEVKRIYATYFFPEMRTDWSSHPNNIGHFNAQGCFRCHDGQHFSKDGKMIRNECTVCHTTLDQTFGGKTYADPNGAFQHPVNLGKDMGNWQCAACHRADRAFKHPLNLGDISRFQCVECHKGGDFKVKYFRQQ